MKYSTLLLLVSFYLWDKGVLLDDDFKLLSVGVFLRTSVEGFTFLNLFTCTSEEECSKHVKFVYGVS